MVLGAKLFYTLDDKHIIGGTMALPYLLWR